MRALMPCLFLVTACNGFLNNPPPPPPGSPMLSLVGNFASPVYLTAAPGDTQRLFVVEQNGRVLVLHHDTVQSRPFLDIRGQIAAGGERGLLSLAFDPQYDTNGRFFVYFSDSKRHIRILRYNVSYDLDHAYEATGGS